MASKIGIAFHHGGIIPASVLKKDKDVSVAAHEAIEVPADYGQHLIDDKFAYAKDVEKVTKAKKAETPTSGATAAEIAAAEKAVTDAEAEVTAAGDDAALKATADQALASAKAALEKLKG
ncbi:hypothetical protein ACIQUB_06210 [Rhizobium sp. NPDC090275]|uniref:hypothetical protein n=1 Tax=Rhizobium sp. NPDC090275 TaxID=3364498 RepID=UPI00383B11E4